MAAANQTSNLLKVNQFSKDLAMKSKDIAELLAGEGIEYKTQRALDANEFAILFDKLTRDNQIKGIEDYLDGITYIPSKKAESQKSAAKAEESAEKKNTVAESKPEQNKPEAKSEVSAESVSSNAAQSKPVAEAPKQEAPKAAPAAAAPAAPAAPVAAPAAAPAAPKAAPAAPKASGAAGAVSVKAPMPGNIMKVNCKVGASVKKGDVLVVLEAMKMENVIEATADGTVTAIKVGKGDSVLEGAPLVIIG